jgi:pyruvate dehydrogenase E2 component (dihydrolipoamide acetyltransferase)
MKPERPSDPEVRTVAVAGGAAAYTDEGQGPVVIALHGLPGGARDWRWLGPVVAPGLRLVRLELPGFGQTPRLAMPDPGFEARARWVLAFADALGVERFAVMGHSVGGPLAMAVAGMAPRRVAGLALVASVGLSVHRGYRQAGPMRKLAPLARVPLLGPALMTPFMRWAFGRFGFKGHSDEALAHTLAIVNSLDFRDNRRFAAAVSVPTLVAWANDDPIIDQAVSEELAAALPAGPRLPFTDGGHNIQKTKAVELGAALVATFGGGGG